MKRRRKSKPKKLARARGRSQAAKRRRDLEAVVKSTLDLVSSPRLFVGRSNAGALPATLTRAWEEYDRKIERDQEIRTHAELVAAALKREEPAAAARSTPRRKRNPGKEDRDQEMYKIMLKNPRPHACCAAWHKAKFRPRKSWTDKGCPSTFPAALMITAEASVNWNQRIHDLRGKLKRKYAPKN